MSDNIEVTRLFDQILESSRTCERASESASQQPVSQQQGEANLSFHLLSIHVFDTQTLLDLIPRLDDNEIKTRGTRTIQFT